MPSQPLPMTSWAAGKIQSCYAYIVQAIITIKQFLKEDIFALASGCFGN